MGQEIKFELTEKAKRLLATVKEMPSWGMDAVCLGMDRANLVALANIQRKHLTGVGPFPPDEHRLGVQSGRLLGGAWASPSVATGTTATSMIGDNVKYAKIHEYGDTIHHEARTGTARLRTDARGNLLHQVSKTTGQIFANLSVFASKKHKASRVKEVGYQAEAYDIEMPERAPFRTGIEEVMDRYGRLVSAEIVAAWRTQL